MVTLMNNEGKVDFLWGLVSWCVSAELCLGEALVSKE